jgi:hypothetical protein
MRRAFKKKKLCARWVGDWALICIDDSAKKEKVAQNERRRRKGWHVLSVLLHADVDTYHFLNVGFDVVAFDIIWHNANGKTSVFYYLTRIMHVRCNGSRNFITGNMSRRSSCLDKATERLTKHLGSGFTMAMVDGSSLYFSGVEINAKVWIQFFRKKFSWESTYKKQFLERAKIFTSLDRVVAMESGWGGMSERGRRQVAQHDCDPTAYTVMMPGHGWVVPLLSSWAFIVWKK